MSRKNRVAAIVNSDNHKLLYASMPNEEKLAHAHAHIHKNAILEKRAKWEKADEDLLAAQAEMELHQDEAQARKRLRHAQQMVHMYKSVKELATPAVMHAIQLQTLPPNSAIWQRVGALAQKEVAQLEKDDRMEKLGRVFGDRFKVMDVNQLTDKFGGLFQKTHSLQ